LINFKEGIVMKRFKLVVFIIIIIALAMTACRRGLESSIWAMPVLEQVAGEIGVPDGVYTGMGDGYYGEVHVEVTVADNSIVAIRVTEHSDTPAFAASVFGALIPAIMARQATGVDLTAGATYTARGLVESIEDALVFAGADLDALRAGPGR
jgi:fumarate reductase flavoprotein subunit